MACGALGCVEEEPKAVIACERAKCVVRRPAWPRNSRKSRENVYAFYGAQRPRRLFCTEQAN